MAKKQFNYSDLSPKELELLKEIYIELKVKSMTLADLKEFATDNISLQIKNTIGNDEEIDAWKEMEEFFKDEFENTIREVQIKIKQKYGQQTNLNTERINLKSEDQGEEIKMDMWED